MVCQSVHVNYTFLTAIADKVKKRTKCYHTGIYKMFPVIDILDVTAKVIALCSTYEATSNELNISFLAQFPQRMLI